MTANIDAPPDEAGFNWFAIAFTVDELAAIASLLNLPFFPGVADPSDSDANEQPGDAAVAAGSRSLLARRVVEIVDSDEGTLRINQPFAALFEVVLDPEVVLRARVQEPDALHERTYYAHRLITVEQAGDAAIHEFAAFAPEILLPSIFTFVAATETAVAEDDRAYQVTRQQLEQLEDIAASGELDPARAIAPNAEQFADAMAHWQRTCEIICLQRQGEMLAGGTLLWVDGGDRGLWVVEPAEGAGEDQLTVRPTTLAALQTELVSYFPDGPPGE